MKKTTTAAYGPLLAPIRTQLDAAESAARRNIANTELAAWERYHAHTQTRLTPISGPLFDADQGALKD